jgi:hypothetical protein
MASHSKRSTLATNILNNPIGYAALMAIGVTDNATVMTDVVIPVTSSLALNVTESTFDSDILFQVNSMFNAYAGSGRCCC